MTTIVKTLRALDQRELSTVELIDSMLDRAIQTESAVHAFVELFAEEARAAAREADAVRASGSDVPALLGIPLGIKDIADMQGKPSRCGSALFEHAAPAAHDAPVVAAWRNDGAILLGKTVTQEFAAGVVSKPARNPWSPDHIPGGSSGGTAASIAAGSTLAGLGTDTGGSIRIPASLCGTVGLKPTWGTLSIEGIYPLSTSLDTPGPLAKSVTDAALLWNSMTGNPDQIPATITALESAHSLSGVRIGVLGGYFRTQVQDDVSSATEAAVSVLRDLGAEVVEVFWADAAAARASGLLISRFEGAALHTTHLREQADLMGEDLRSRLEVSSLLPGTMYIDAQKARRAVRDSMAELFRSHHLDAVVAPTTPATAPRADSLECVFADGAVEPVGSCMTRFTTPFNSTGQPVISLPSGFDRNGLPTGLSIVGRPFQELRICAIAHAYERATEWHTQQPGL